MKFIMQFTPYLLWLLVAAATPAAAECECLWQGSFSEVAGDTQLVVSGKVASTKGNSIDLSVERLMAGKEAMETIRIWLKTGDYCRPEAALFPPGSRWVMALHRVEEMIPGGFNPSTPNLSYGRVGDYRLSSCGGYWLDLNDQWVTGNLIQAPRWVRDPKMTPVLLDLVADYVAGTVSAEALLEASREDPELRNLILDTREFLRQEH